MPWHITPHWALGTILKDGLEPRIGSRSSEVGETEAAVHLFGTLADLESAGWIEDAFEEDEVLSLLHVAAPFPEGAWAEIPERIDPSMITLIAADWDSFIPTEAHRAMDKAADPFRDVDSFRATMVTMPAEKFGEVVQDQQWEGETQPFLVYAAGFWIEQTENGHELTIERDAWSTDETTTLSDLEERLFTWAAAERRPEPRADHPEP